MESSQCIVFRGEIIEGFDAEEVKLSAQSRLNASPSQIEQLFSGRPAILKKDLDAASGARYLALLAHIGMRASLELQTDEANPAPEPESPKTSPSDSAHSPLASESDLPPPAVEAQQPEPSPVAEPEPVTKDEPAPIPERIVTQMHQPRFARTPEPKPAVEPRQRPRPRPAPLSDPQTVFIDEDAPDQISAPVLSSRKAAQWPERLLLALIAAAICYTLYWAVTRY
ncbi:hypothetical protein [Niveibacterium terrae]|uniref:hypothetical protein n=1 Tax=Niveibacterium terrae TaxID=3373598 RepID=UPI003A91BBB6